MNNNEELLTHVSGVYSITNKTNGKMYIGESMDIERRWKEHIEELKNNEHGNYLLQSDFNEYGLDNFEFKILQEHNTDSIASTKCQILMLENKYICKCEKDGITLYNIEHSLKKLLTSGDLKYAGQKGFSLSMLNILAGQIMTYKFISDKDTFILVARPTPIKTFIELGGYKTGKKANENYIEFEKALKRDYKNEMNRIINKIKFEYKTYKSYSRNIEEVTEYGLTVFNEIFNKYPYLKNAPMSKSKLEYKLNGQTSFSEFTLDISNKLGYAYNPYTIIREWLVKLNLIKILNKHTYATDYAISNGYLENNKEMHDKEIKYYSILVNKSCRDYIFGLIDNMSDEEKLKTFMPFVCNIN